MHKYNFVYKRVSVATQQIVMVEAEIEAKDATVTDGSLVFYDEQDVPLMALPPGTWAFAERADPTNIAETHVNGPKLVIP